MKVVEIFLTFKKIILVMPLFTILIILMIGCAGNPEKKRIGSLKKDSYKKKPVYHRYYRWKAEKEKRYQEWKKEKASRKKKKYSMKYLTDKKRNNYEKKSRSYKRFRRRFRQVGIASWYGKTYHRRKTSSGETFNMYGMTAAHRKLPFGTYVRVKNLRNGKSVKVRINDRGPFVQGRVINLSYKAAKQLDIINKGVVRVEIVIDKQNKHRPS